eukprot:3686415-Amphidinium_carterae.1
MPLSQGSSFSAPKVALLRFKPRRLPSLCHCNYQADFRVLNMDKELAAWLSTSTYAKRPTELSSVPYHSPYGCSRRARSIMAVPLRLYPDTLRASCVWSLVGHRHLFFPPHRWPICDSLEFHRFATLRNANEFSILVGRHRVHIRSMIRYDPCTTDCQCFAPRMCWSTIFRE